MNILVTGGAGFIGSHIVEALMADPSVGKVRIMDNLSTGFLDNIKPFLGQGKVEFMRADLRFLNECRKAVKDMDAVCHQAAIGSVPRSIDDPITTHDNNVNGFVNLLEAAKGEGIKKFVYASSSSVYGDAADSPKFEERIGKPLSPYAVSKYANELYAEVFARCYGMQLIGFRYFNVFGPRQDPFGPYAAVIPLFIKAALTGMSPIINGDGSITRDYTYVKNVVKANLNALDPSLNLAGNNVYNIACGHTTTLNTLWETIRELTGATIEAEHRPNRKGDILHSLANVSRAERDLSYTDLVLLKQGLAETIPWYEQQIHGVSKQKELAV
jgi:UDP-N-acetylglucosamine 4-epimerase